MLGATDVLSYDLDLELTAINPDANTCVITGINTMTVGSSAPALTEFSFRLRSQFSVTSALLNGVTPVTVNMVSDTTRQVTLDRTYALGETFSLSVGYTGTTVSDGFGSIQVARQLNGTPVVATLSEPYYAYTWWPVKDGDLGEPGDNSDKAVVNLSVTVPGGYTVAANGLLTGVDSLSAGRLRYHWASSYAIAPYLVSFSATVYNTWTAGYVHAGGTMPVEFFIYPGSDTTPNRFGWERSVDMLSAFAALYGEYPFIAEKYGIYQFPFGGGMEHQTMTGQCCFSESLTAHELAHQWWGDMITCETWSDIWLNEGFATYSECLWEEYKSGSADPTAYRSAVLARKPSNVSGSVYVPPSQTDSVARIFSGNWSYRKGCWVLHQLRHVVGDETFFDILADYRTAYAYSSATTADFEAVASARHGADLSWFFDQWVYGIGAPAYEYGWTTATVAGQAYVVLRIRQTQGGGYPPIFEMPIDLRVTTAFGTTTKTVWNDANVQWFVLPVPDTASALAFDPDSWILSTSNTTAVYSPGPPKIVRVEPVPGQPPGHDGPVDEIAVTFHTPVHAIPSDFSLVGAQTGAQGFSLATGIEPEIMLLQFADPLPTDTYTLTIQDGITAVDSGLMLDGEVASPSTSGALPSGDGVPGGTAAFTLNIAYAIPAASEWTLLVLAIAMLTAATLALRRVRAAP
jgi:aminopeptidase N